MCWIFILCSPVSNEIFLEIYGEEILTVCQEKKSYDVQFFKNICPENFWNFNLIFLQIFFSVDFLLPSQSTMSTMALGTTFTKITLTCLC